MTRVQPADLGNAYPALCYFLKLTALTLGRSQMVLTVRVRAEKTGVFNYGRMPRQALLTLLNSRPYETMAAVSAHLSIGTFFSQKGSELATDAPILGVQFQAGLGLCPLALYVPDLTCTELTTQQMDTLGYLTQQLRLTLALAQSFHLLVHAVEAPKVAHRSGGAAIVPKEVPTELWPVSQPSLVKLVMELQACLSYSQLSKLLNVHLPIFFPNQAGRMVLLGSAAPGLAILTQWGDGVVLEELNHQCPFTFDQVPQLTSPCNLNCQPCQPESDTAHLFQCIVLGQPQAQTCIVQLQQAGNETLTLSQQTVIDQLAEHLLPVIERLRVLEDLQAKALRDPLTDLMNRRYMEEMLDNLCQHSNQGYQISVILIDVDHFKKVNDTYGHQAGDSLLKDLSILLKGHVRSNDVVCRYGGEEFCMILLDTPPNVAIKRAEKIRRAVKYLTLSFASRPLDSLSISLGVACFPDHGQSPEELIAKADKALYWAKNHGRDQSVRIDQIALA